MRRESERGAFVTVLRKGAQQAGAVFVVELLDGNRASVFAPAPQSLLPEESGERLFEKMLENVEQADVDVYLERQLNFDPDLWIVETQSGKGEITLKCVS